MVSLKSFTNQKDCLIDSGCERIRRSTGHDYPYPSEWRNCWYHKKTSHKNDETKRHQANYNNIILN